MKKTDLIIEKGKNKRVWGRIKIMNDLMVESASTVPGLTKKIRKTLLDFYGISEIEFNHVYDISAFFSHFEALNITQLAALASINPSLLRQYASGSKFPTAKQAIKIEKAIHQLALDLSSVSIYTGKG